MAFFLLSNTLTTYQKEDSTMKLRKILVLTLTLLMVLSCTAFAVAETRPLKVALLLTSNLGDKGFYDSQRFEADWRSFPRLGNQVRRNGSRPFCVRI